MRRNPAHRALPFTTGRPGHRLAPTPSRVGPRLIQRDRLLERDIRQFARDPPYRRRQHTAGLRHHIGRIPPVEVCCPPADGTPGTPVHHPSGVTSPAARSDTRGLPSAPAREASRPSSAPPRIYAAPATPHWCSARGNPDRPDRCLQQLVAPAARTAPSVPSRIPTHSSATADARGLLPGRYETNFAPRAFSFEMPSLIGLESMVLGHAEPHQVFGALPVRLARAPEAAAANGVKPARSPC